MLDALSRAPLNGATFRVLIQLLWQVYGFADDQGKERAFTYEQLARVTGLARSTVAKAIGEAVARCILAVETKRGRVSNLYAFRPLDEWDFSQRQGTVNRPASGDGSAAQQSGHRGRFPTPLHKERRTRREEPDKNPASSYEDAVTAPLKIRNEDDWILELAASPLSSRECAAIVDDADRMLRDGELTREQAVQHARARLMVDVIQGNVA